MAIENVSSTSESVPNQEQVSVVRENDRSLSISVDASATASTDGESSSETVTGAEQANNDVDGTDTSYSTDQEGEDDTTNTHNKELLTALGDLSTKIDEVIELLGGQSGDSTPDETQSTGGDTPVDASQTGTSGTDNMELAETLEPVVIDLYEILEILYGLSNSEQPEEPSGPSNIGEQFVDIYSNELSVPEGRMEIIDLLASGEFGEDGKKIAELLPNMTGVNGEEFWNEDAYLEIKEIMLESGEAEEIVAAMESISK